MLYDGSNQYQKNYVNSVKIVFKALRIRDAMYYDKYEANGVLTNLLKAADEKDKTYVLYNLFSDTLISEWGGLTDDQKKRITLVNVAFISRIEVYNANKDGSFFQAENAVVPDEFVNEIDAKVTGTSTQDEYSQEAIILFEFLNLYYKVGDEYFGGDLSGGSDILFKIYDEDYYNELGLTFTINTGNRLITPIQSAKLGTTENSQFKISSFATYAIVDGYPNEEVCDLRIGKDYSDPDVYYIVLAAYQYSLYGNEFAKYEVGMINAFNGAINYLNENVYIKYKLFCFFI